MKPSWDNAPEWANYLAMDEDGVWFWFSGIPYLADNTWQPGRLRCLYAGTGLNWKETLEERVSE